MVTEKAVPRSGSAPVSKLVDTLVGLGPRSRPSRSASERVDPTGAFLTGEPNPWACVAGETLLGLHDLTRIIGILDDGDCPRSGCALS
jgi:hypothetical protein